MHLRPPWVPLSSLLLTLLMSIPSVLHAAPDPLTEKEYKPLPPVMPKVLSQPASWDVPFPTSPVLHAGPPQAAGMRPEPLNALDTSIRQAINQGHMPGAVLLVARRGVIVKQQAYGYAAKYLDQQQTPLAHPVPMDNHTLFDLASISKIFTTIAVMNLYEEGAFALDDPVSRYIPEFAQNGKASVTIKQLLTHTSGFRPGIPLYTMGHNRDDRLAEVFRYPLDHAPGSTYVYSDLNMIALGALVERLSGERLDQYVKETVTGPLGMKHTMYNPPAWLKYRTAATEYQSSPDRGLVWGEVHDENAASLDGVAGHAGVFSTAGDLAKLAHLFLLKGKYGSTRILEEKTVELMEHNFNADFPGDDHGLGWELNQGWYMDALASPYAFGHTGFTGTSLVINREQSTITILLTNRVHPTRQTPSLNPVRRQTARLTADAIPVSMRQPAWFAGYGDQLNRTLTATLPEHTGKRKLQFSTWHHIEAGVDFGIVEVSTDGNAWQPLYSFTGRSQGWEHPSLPLPDTARHVRFRYQTDGSVNGRGWYVGKPALVFENGHILPLQVTGSEWEQREY
ncbi:serine hydrolase domain-containing protein [Laceyella putida]|uniref:Serine hydrolase n=1 Tax=Laceyella putida TaxID=110101 RepID=A0ABW2RHZ8_9BACL